MELPSPLNRAVEENARSAAIEAATADPRATTPAPQAIAQASSTLQWMVVVALCAVFFGRAMDQALPGSRSGLGKWLETSHWVSAFFTQLLAVLVVTVGGRLSLTTSFDRHISYWQRLQIALSASAVIFLVICASLDFLIGPYTPELSLLLGIAATNVALGSAAVCSRPASVRLGAIILALATAGSIAQISARLLAMQASDAALPTQYMVSRWVASTAAVIDAVSLVTVVVWIVRRDVLNRISVLARMGVAVLLGFAAERGATPNATFAEVLVSRLFAQLHREPSAMFPRVFQNAQEALAMIVAVWLLHRPRSVRLELRASLAMLLLARSSPDIPLCAGLLVTGALGLVAIAAESRHSTTDMSHE
jgi:hypothetical protein